MRNLSGPAEKAGRQELMPMWSPIDGTLAA